MDAKTLYAAMLNGDYILNVKDNILEVREARWIDDELEQLIREHKDELIRLVIENQ